MAPPTRPAPRKQAFRDQATRGCAVGWKLRPPAVPEPGEMIGRALERVARTHPAAQQVHRQVQRPQHHVLVHVCAFVIIQPDQRLHAPPGLVRIGAAGDAQVMAGVQDHIAQRDRPTRSPRPAVEHQRTITAAPAHCCATQHAGQAADHTEQ
ncbi:hypothetical protein H2198_010919 [Neophaeococcomyces mojaviensis]|uniref:Uncharacterized protein n=1 Tax=Neophaeococcomyces mojaviensis TaxID=3383035 RepID=A0ACC2ZNS4_9EURO|nr:hypothetical protein H2198_010919 [Knufia sp. JES_112]